MEDKHIHLIGVAILVLIDTGMTRKEFKAIKKTDLMKCWDYLEKSENEKNQARLATTK